MGLRVGEAMIFWLRHPDKSWTQLHRVLYAYEVVPNRPETRSVAVRRSTLGFFSLFVFENQSKLQQFQHSL